MAAGKSAILAGKAKVIERQIDGIDGIVKLRACKYDEVKSWFDDPDGDAKAIAASLIDDDGKPVLSLKEAHQLPRNIFGDLVQAALEANGYGAEAKKN